MKKLLVIGRTGFIGYHVIKEAQKRKINVYSVSLKKPKAKRYLKGVKYILGDISKYKILKKKLKINFEYIVNAGGYGIHPKFGKQGDKLIKNHFLGLINILKVLPIKKIKKFIQIGSSAEYGRAKSPIKENFECTPRTPYSVAKFLCSKYLMNLFFQQKFPVTIFRLFQVYGPKQDDNRIIPFLIKNCMKNKKFLTTKGEQLCDFCHIDDIVDAIFKSLCDQKSNGDIFNIGLGKPIQIKKLINFTVKEIGKGKPIIGGLKYKEDTNKKNYPNINKIKKKLKWKPKINIYTGIKKTIESFR